MPARRLLFLGDICAKPGRAAVANMIPALRRELELDFVVANGENAAAGYGITPGIADELFRSGVDCITTGDHFLDRKEIEQYLDTEPRLLRPLNFPAGVPGHGSGFFEVNGLGIGVVNLLGRVFLKPVDCPFQRVLPEVARLRALTRVIVVDFHAEATAEKIALGWYLDGEVTAVLGTHTHVATADERLLERGTAYISDVGMCGGMDSVLGMQRERAVRRMMWSVPMRLQPSAENVRVSGVLVEFDPDTGRAGRITRLVRDSVPAVGTDEPEPGVRDGTGADIEPKDERTAEPGE